MLDKNFLLEELKERINYLRTVEKDPNAPFPTKYRERRQELERWVRHIELGIYDKNEE